MLSVMLTTACLQASATGGGGIEPKAGRMYALQFTLTHEGVRASAINKDAWMANLRRVLGGTTGRAFAIAKNIAELPGGQMLCLVTRLHLLFAENAVPFSRLQVMFSEEVIPVRGRMAYATHVHCQA